MIKAGILKFFRSEAGAVTVDWVVLTASVVSLGAVMGALIWSNTDNAAIDVATFIGSQSLMSTF